jgi:hypothetical protein
MYSDKKKIFVKVVATDRTKDISQQMVITFLAFLSQQQTLFRKHSVKSGLQ